MSSCSLVRHKAEREPLCLYIFFKKYWNRKGERFIATIDFILGQICRKFFWSNHTLHSTYSLVFWKSAKYLKKTLSFFNISWFSCYIIIYIDDWFIAILHFVLDLICFKMKIFIWVLPFLITLHKSTKLWEYCEHCTCFRVIIPLMIRQVEVNLASKFQVEKLDNLH